MQLLHNIMKWDPVTERKGYRAGKSSLRRIIEQVHDVLVDEVLVITDRNQQVVGRHPLTLTILDQRTKLVLLRNLDILRDSAEDLIRLTV